jgi:hypothetical protein
MNSLILPTWSLCYMDKQCTGPFKSAVRDSKDIPTKNLTIETVSNYVNIVHCSRSRTPSSSLVRRLFCVCVCVCVCVGGRGESSSPPPSPQFSLGVHEVKTGCITVADFTIGTGRTTRLIRD